MTGIGTSGYSDLIRQAIASGRGKTNAQGSASCSETSMFSAVIRNISYDNSVLVRMESKRDSSGRWTDERLYTLDEDAPEGYRVNRSALAEVRAHLKEEGVEADKRTPTHEITDEQMDWLGSRYDLEFLSICSFTHPEYGNFMLDLAYLNVFSLDEVENMYGVMPFNANNKAYLYYHGELNTGKGAGYMLGDGNMSDDWEDVYTKVIMEYLKVKYTGRTESEYRRMTEEMKIQRLERMMIIEDFFARIPENKEDNYAAVSKPAIEDASEKLKEDFGALIS